MKKLFITLFIALSLILPVQGSADITKFGGFLPCTSDNGTICTTTRYIMGSAEGLLSVTNVSLAANADTTLYTVPTGKRLVLTKAIVIAGNDAASTDISIGQDGAETDWIGTTQCDNLDAANDVIILQPVPAATPVKSKSYAAGTVIQMNVANHAGGATNSVRLFGYLY